MSEIELINPIDKVKFKDNLIDLSPFPYFCIDNFLDEDFANEIYEAFPSFQESQKVGREFNAVNEKKKIQITDSTKFPPAILKLHKLLASKEFLEMMSDLMGIPNLVADPKLIGGGIHETSSGGRLDVHVDFNYLKDRKLYRRLNILIYFNKDWKEEYGGDLDIWDKDVKNCCGSFAPVFNRACGFATSEVSYHGVMPVNCPDGEMRKSFATYFYTAEAPENGVSDYHSTIFKARPKEWFREGLLMPAEGVIRKTRSQYKAIKHKIKELTS